MTAPTPLLDFFKKGEVPRDVRLLAAQGGLAVRAHEQLAILVCLLEDADAEVRGLAETTLDRIPVDALQKFLARPDVSIGLREFFGDRGVFPDEIPPIDAEEVLIAVGGPGGRGGPGDDDVDEGTPFDESEDRETTVQRISKMGFTARLKAAVKGSREMRAILVRDPNKMIAAAVLSSPKLSEPEVESIARMTNVSEEVLRIIGHNRAWTKNYGVLVGLVKNPKTPVALSMNMMARLNDRDLSQLSVDRNVPDPLRVAARRRLVSGAKS